MATVIAILALPLGVALGWMLSRVRLTQRADLGKLDVGNPERRRFLIDMERRGL